jgi:hypothetical protein
MDCSRKRASPTRVTLTRVKTGCLTCRQRKKKCDEVRPVCTGCMRNYIECTWPETLVAVNATKKRMSSDVSVRRTVERTISWSSDGTGESEWAFHRNQATVPDHDTPISSSSIVDIDQEEEVGGKETNAILWNPLTASFASPNRALSLNPYSILLLQHYLEATSIFLAAKPQSSNPFITLVLPLAYSDDLLMHAVLALSGTHLSFAKREDLRHHLPIQLATRQHYSLLLRNLRCMFADELAHNDHRRMLRLLLILVVLCHVEVGYRLLYVDCGMKNPSADQALRPSLESRMVASFHTYERVTNLSSSCQTSRVIVTTTSKQSEDLRSNCTFISSS